MTTLILYNQLVAVGEKYLGPAGERFIRRQIDFHLNKKPETITQQDVAKLSGSIKIALEILTEDKTMVNTAVHDIKSLATNGQRA